MTAPADKQPSPVLVGEGLSSLRPQGGSAPGIEPEQGSETGDFYDDEDECEDEFDCAWMPGTGQCMAAGSEDCDWSCPFHDDYAAESRTLAAGEDAAEAQPIGDLDV